MEQFPQIIQGRLLNGQDIADVRRLIEANPSWSRRQISQELAKIWNWRSGAGLLKDMAARSLLGAARAGCSAAAQAGGRAAQAGGGAGGH